ncbi:MAG: ribonuclease Z [Bacteroidales bacterium]|jgi:ribonuclease Z|nr:ribonuclease Z [Bacteroidales bacterium]
MTLTILGSSSALPTSERFPSAHVLNVHERLFLIDCGEGTQMQMRRNRIKFTRINHIFITHLHGDHVFGIYGLLSSFSLMGRVNPLNIYGPENYSAMLRSHLADFDINLNFEITFTPVSGNDPRVILDDRHLTVTSFPLDHRVPAFGYLFREKQGERKIIKECIEKYNIPLVSIPLIKKGADFTDEKGRVIKNEELSVPGPEPQSYAYCSDTRYFSRLPSFVRGADLLYHEATFDASLKELALKTGHSTTHDAATVASQAGVKQLIIGHFSSRYRKTDSLVEEARTIFPETYPAIDGKTYEPGKIDCNPG